jgi:hypothetical protein
MPSTPWRPAKFQARVAANVLPRPRDRYEKLAIANPKLRDPGTAGARPLPAPAAERTSRQWFLVSASTADALAALLASDAPLLDGRTRADQRLRALHWDTGSRAREYVAVMEDVIAHVAARARLRMAAVSADPTLAIRSLMATMPSPSASAAEHSVGGGVRGPGRRRG